MAGAAQKAAAKRRTGARTLILGATLFVNVLFFLTRYLLRKDAGVTGWKEWAALAATVGTQLAVGHLVAEAKAAGEAADIQTDLLGAALLIQFLAAFSARAWALLPLLAAGGAYGVYTAIKAPMAAVMGLTQKAAMSQAYEALAEKSKDGKGGKAAPKARR